MPSADILPIIKSRKSVHQFGYRKVSDRNINKILEAAVWAPSFLNTQPWTFIVVKNVETIEKLMALAYYGYFHHRPPVLIAVVIKPRSVDQKILRKEGFKEFIETHEYIDVGFPVSNMINEAKSLGIDSFIVSPHTQKANKILSVPQDRKTVLLVGLGYEKKTAYKKPRVRKPLEEVVFTDKYGGKE